jgi:hypothetical protein
MTVLQYNPVYFSSRVEEPSAPLQVDPGSIRPLRLPGCGSYVVELVTSGTALDPLSVPHVDLFELYRLYCDVGVDRGARFHVLRLGFFSDARIAKTVARYLATYFDAPRVVQVSAAEQERAPQQRFVARKDVGASGPCATIELTAPRPLPVAAIKPKTTCPAREKTFWSRFIEFRRR